MGCNLCPRQCNIDRSRAPGVCRSSETVRVARAALHYGEEPFVTKRRIGTDPEGKRVLKDCKDLQSQSGLAGEKKAPPSGAVFFSGCSLGCIYCQNEAISHKGLGKDITPERLADIFRELCDKGASNIDLVSAAHYTPQVIQALKLYRPPVPVVYNSSGYERTETLRMLEKYVDIYLPDIKYADSDLAERFSHAPDYPERAFDAVEEMLLQKGTEAVLIRHLVLPLHLKNTEAVLAGIADRFGRSVNISLMLQYTPVVSGLNYPELNRTLTQRECRKAEELLYRYGFEKGYIQEPLSAAREYIPEWNLEGV